MLEKKKKFFFNTRCPETTTFLRAKVNFPNPNEKTHPCTIRLEVPLARINRVLEVLTAVKSGLWFFFPKAATRIFFFKSHLYFFKAGTLRAFIWNNFILSVGFIYFFSLKGLPHLVNFFWSVVPTWKFCFFSFSSRVPSPFLWDWNFFFGFYD